MLVIFDIPYMVCCDFYKKREQHKDDVGLSGVLLLSVIYTLNIMFISMYSTNNHSIFYFDIITNEYHLLGVFFAFLVLVYMRFYKIVNYEKISNQFKGMTESKQKSYYIFSVVYLIISVVLTVGYAMATGGK